MPVVSKLVHALHRKRLTGLLIAASLCTLLGACGDDDRSADSTAVSNGVSGSLADSNAPSPTQDNPLSASATASPAPAAVLIQTPAVSANGTDTALSAAASAPLATPVIHTVD